MFRRILKNPLFRFFASLKLAVVCLLTVAAVLATATCLESLYGMRAVHVLVYGTPWFAGILCLLGTNVFCAAMSRFPWKKHQTGFVITHAGILTILFGSLLTQRLGVDGNLPVVEGQKEADVILNDMVLSLSDENGRSLGDYPLRESAYREQGRLFEIDVADGAKIVGDDFIPRAVFERRMVKSPVTGVGLPAVRVELANSRFTMAEWLQPRHPEAPTELNLGPAVLAFRKLWTPAEEAEFRKPPAAEDGKGGRQGFVVASYRGKEYRVDIAGNLDRWRRLGSTPFEVKLTRYLPYAIVEGNALVNKSEEPLNPAVQLLLRDGTGVEEHHTIFANFPEFATLHKAYLKPGQKALSVKLAMRAPGRGPTEGRGQGKLLLAQSADDKRLLYRVLGKKGDLKAEGEAKLGEAVVTGWMDIRFKVTDWIDHAVEEESPRYVEFLQGGGETNFPAGLRLHVEEGGTGRGVSGLPPGTWLPEGATRSFAIAGQEIFVQFGKRRLTLPFQIHLDKFTIGTDPGTTKAASYASNVQVKDDGRGVEQKALISMNEPLKYGGYYFYQASYQMDEGKAPVSIFSVNYDPGRPVKYAGSLVMVFGIILMFWWNPHYVGKMIGRKPKGAEV